MDGVRPQSKNRSVPFFAVPFFFVVLLGAFGFPAVAASATTTVEDVDRLLNTGAVALALRVVEQDQPKYSASPVSWQRWERRRLAVLESRGDWPAVIARVAEYPSSLPDDFWIAAQESAARAYLATGDAGSATVVVAGLIWSTAQDTAMFDESVERLNRWRAMLAESYLLAGRLSDARTTALRYRLDYAADPEGWRIAHAKALLRAGRGVEARELLIGLETTQATYMKLLLRARNVSVDPVELLSEMGPLLGEGKLAGAQRAQLWASLANAAVRYRDHEVRVTAMEQAVALRAPSGAPLAAGDRLVSVDADALWDAYAAYAAALANESNLLVGRFGDWLALAETSGAADGLKARAMYAYLATQNRDARVADIARTGLVSMLTREPRGLAILGRLYLESRRYPKISAIPAAVRAPLIAFAVGESRLDAAEKLLAGLDPEARRGLAPEWRAPVAVALIGNGRVDEALALFGEDFDAGGSPEPVAVDAAVSVALALQVAGEYQQAATLLSRALAISRSPWERRELLLLAAESEGYAGRHDRAARLFIESATRPDGGPADDWSRSASLQAARALARAGLDEDAVGVLRSILADSPRPSDRAFVEQAMRRF